MVRRIYVEKKKEFAIEAKDLYFELKENLNIKGISELRVVNRYDIEGIDEKTYEAAKYTVFSEPAVDAVYDEELPIEEGSWYFAIESLPGQFDQRSDSAAQCIGLMNIASSPVVHFAKIIILAGDLTKDEVKAIKDYCINPIESREARIDKPHTLEEPYTEPEKVPVIEGFTQMSHDELIEYKNAQGFAMSNEDIKFIQEYFNKTEERDPTITELRVLDTYWSDHCRHTTFFTKINSVTFDQGGYTRVINKAFEEYLAIRKETYGNQERDISLMDLAVIGAKYLKKEGFLEDLDESDEINACSIKVKAVVDGKEEDWLVMFKNETHNHPTEMEPFGGAATCLGGAIRDPLSGRVYVYQAMRVTGSGDPRTKIQDTLPGKLPQRKITKSAAQGYSSYGNQIGVASGHVSEIYHEGYVAKRMEAGATIGAAPSKNVIRKRPEKGDVVILVGGRTGRDGIGGATGSSKGHTEESLQKSGAEVQKGNPPIERNLQRLFRRPEAAQMIKRCNDFGAGGVSVAIGELADSIDVNLDLVPTKYGGLDGTELAIAESQERMAVVVSKEDAEGFIGYAVEENLKAVAVAEVTDTGRFRIFWQEDCILDLSREFLDTNGVQQVADVHVTNISGEFKHIPRDFMADLKDLNCCSQKGLVEMFDSTIGSATVLLPLGGKYQLSPAVGMASKLPVTEGYTDTSTLMAYGYDPMLSSLSPFHGALYAVVESATKIVAMGGDYTKIRLSFQEYFERLEKDPKKWGKPFAALLGALKAQLELKIPAIGGKDSMSGSFMDLDVPPTLISFATSTVDANQVISTELKSTESQLVYLTTDKDQDHILDFEQYRRNMEAVNKLVVDGKILAANTIGRGGIFLSLVKMAVGNKIGVDLKGITVEELQEPDYGALLLEVDKSFNVEELFSGAKARVIGETKESEELSFRLVANDGQEKVFAASLDEVIRDWTSPLETVFPLNIRDEEEASITPVISYKERNQKKPGGKIAKPKVLIPVFPGTSGEVDAMLAFEKAGAVAELQIIRNINPTALKDSIKEFANKIKDCQMMMIPGGLSGGNEPDGAAKFITAIFRNSAISEAVTELIENRDGLMLGIDNGFQALIKLGLVPYGKIVEQDENNPTLTYNKIGRHVSSMVTTRIASIKSPWLSKVEVGDLHTLPFSNGEGRFAASEKVLKQLIENGQIATQYIDVNELLSGNSARKQIGSALDVEGITSPDGRIFGKMAHSERFGQNLYKNVTGSVDQKIFESGVEYFG
ncbi:MAG: phosphoribosylformylglycinamidine synthase [Anaerovoracaceae bacterium]